MSTQRTLVAILGLAAAQDPVIMGGRRCPLLASAS